MTRFGILGLSVALFLTGCGEQSSRPGAEQSGAITETAATVNGTEAAPPTAAAVPRNAHEHERAAPAGPTRAVCVLESVGDSGVSGVIHFARVGDKVQVRGKVTGLEPGKHGFHVHQYGDTTDRKTGNSAGGHFNPTGKPHGAPGDKERHAGDFGNIEADDSGTANVNFDDPVVQLSGPHAIIGRGLVVHAKEDRFTQPTGDAGDRVAVGVIGVAAAEEKK